MSSATFVALSVLRNVPLGVSSVKADADAGQQEQQERALALDEAARDACGQRGAHSGSSPAARSTPAIAPMISCVVACAMG